MRHLFTLVFNFIFCIICISQINSSQYDVTNIPANLLIDVNQVIRNKEIEFKIIDVDKSQTTSKLAYTLLKRIEDDDKIHLDYSDLKKYDKVEVIVFDKSGKELKKYKKSDFTDIVAFDYSTFFSNARILQLTVSISTYPVTIEINTVFQEKSSFFYPDIYPISQYGQSTQQQVYAYVMPKSFDILYENKNIFTSPKLIEFSENKVYQWTIEPITGFKKESYQPFSLIPAVYISPSKFNVDGVDGSMSSWENFSTFIYNLNEDTRSITPQISSLVEKITENCKNDSSKIEAIYAHVKQTMRYVNISVGVGGFKSHEASYVQKHSFGDCKALTNYTMTLLQGCGINSHWVLIYRGDEEDAVKYGLFPNPKFNHVVLYIPQYETWLECTSNNLPVGYLGIDNMNRQGLLINDNNGYLIKTPNSKTELNTVSLISTIYPTQDLKANVIFEITYEGASHDDIRYYADQLNGKQKEARFVNSIDVAVQEIQDLQYSYTKDEPNAKVKCEFTLAKFASRSGNRIFLPINILNKIDIKVEADSINKDSFYLSEDHVNKVDIYYQIDSSLTNIESLPFTNIYQTTPFLTYQAKVTLEGELIHYQRSCTFRKGIYSSSLFPSYKEIIKIIQKSENSKVVLKVEN